MERRTGGWRVGGGGVKQDHHRLGNKNKKNMQILIQIYLLPLEIKNVSFAIFFFFYVPFFSDLVIFSFDNHSWVDFFFSLKGSKF